MELEGKKERGGEGEFKIGIDITIRNHHRETNRESEAAR